MIRGAIRPLPFLAAIILTIVLALACGDDAAPTPTGTVTPTPIPAPSATPTRTPGPSPMISPSPTPSAFGIEYTVAPGDTLFSIAQRYGTTVEAIVDANGLSDPNLIEVGQVLIIPVSATPVVTPAPTATEAPGGPAQVIRIGDTNTRRVAFTFDAGADVGYTDLILDTLAANNIPASFGMTGRWAEENTSMMRRIVDEGHELINHSYDHASFTGLSTGQPPLTQDERWRQLDLTEQIVDRIAGATTKPYFRPPYGDYDASVNEDVGARGYAYNILWTVDSRGWRGISSAEIAQRCLSLAEPGAIYVFHVGGQSLDGVALQDVIDGLSSQGYAIGDLSGVLPR